MPKDTTFEIRAGHGQQLGANYDGKGVNFALFSAHAERVELCLFDPSGKTEITRPNCRNIPMRSGTVMCRI